MTKEGKNTGSMSALWITPPTTLKSGLSEVIDVKLGFAASRSRKESSVRVAGILKLSTFSMRYTLVLPAS